MDRGRGAGPVLDRLPEVLRGKDLHRVIKRQCRARGIGARVILVPRRAFHEVHCLRASAFTSVALNPQKPARRVRHRHEVPAVVCRGAHQLPQHPDDGS